MGLRVLQALKPANKPENLIFVGSIATVAVGAAQGVLNTLDVFGSKAMVEMLAFIACMWLLPCEKRALWSAKLVVILLALGILGGVVWVAVVGYPARDETSFITWEQVPFRNYVLGAVTSCLVAPLFEEKVVRHLLQSGLSHYFGRFFGTLAVSVLFAIVHTGAVISSFLFALYLSASMYLLSLDTLQRAVVHGAINAVILHWVLVYPNL